MYLIQPCCAKRNLRELRDSIARGGTKQFEGYGDLSLTELLPALLLRYDGVEMMIIAPSLPDQAAEIIDVWMRRQWASKDGKGKLDVIGHLTIMARLEKESSATIMNWIEQRPFGDRLTLIDQEQEETAILLPDFAITGPVNMRYNKHFTAEATTDMEKVKALWERFSKTTGDAAATAQAPALPAEGGSPKAAATKKRKTKKSKKQ